MLKALLLTFALLPLASQASLDRAGKFDFYVINRMKSGPVEVKATTTFQTNDHCNHFGLTGSFREVKGNEPSRTVVQDFVGDFSVIQTEMACPPSPRERTISLESEPLRIEPINGWVYARILVPENMKLRLVE